MRCSRSQAGSRPWETSCGRRSPRGAGTCPPGRTCCARSSSPSTAVRVLIVGQDPYPTPGHAVGLSFSVAPQVRRLPGSLVNIFREYSDDLGYPSPATGDLTPWSERGVLLLNRVLTVAPGQAGIAPREGLGRGDRPGHQGAGGAAGADGGDLVGTRRADARAAARGRPPHRVGASESRIRRRADFSAHIRSAGLIRCLSSKEPNRSTGSFPRPVRVPGNSRSNAR